MKGKEVLCEICGNTVLEGDAVLVESGKGKGGDIYQCLDCAEEQQGQEGENE